MATLPLEGMSWAKLVEYGTGLSIPVTFSRDGRRLAVVADATVSKIPASRTVAIWDLASRSQLFASPVEIGDVFGLAFRPDGQRLAIGGGQSWRLPLDGSSQMQSGQVKMLEADSGKAVLTFQAQAVGINALDFSPDGQQLATVGRDGEIGLWNAVTGAPLRKFQDPRKLSWGVAFSPDGKRLATASGDHTVKLWDPQMGRLVFSIRAHLTGVSYLAFSEDGQRLASVGVNGVIKVWDVGTPQH
jgi:WD40 repeat protein